MEGVEPDALSAVVELDSEIGSEDLDRLESEAEKEMMEELQREGTMEAVSLTADASSASEHSEANFGPLPREEIQELLLDLQQLGLAECLRKVVSTDAEKIVPMLLSLGVMLPRSVLEKAEVNPLEALPLLKLVLTRILRQRRKLDQYNTIEDVLHLLKNAKNIIVLCGAGISVSCGIPDFRSKDGIYSILAKEDRYELDDPSDMFDKDVFLNDPSLFYSFAHSIYPSNYVPSPSHYFVKELERQGKLLHLYSQNIDTLEQKAGIQNVIQCHGSFATATCTNPSCGYKVDGAVIRDDILAKRVPACLKCETQRAAFEEERRKKRRKLHNLKYTDEDNDNNAHDPVYGIMKPDITFFGEKLPDTFEQGVLHDRDLVDLVLVMGTSLKVAPVSDLLSHTPSNVPVVLINRTPITHIAMDVMLLGDSDKIVQYLSSELGWNGSEKSTTVPLRVGNSHIYQFPGAELGSELDYLLDEETDSNQGLTKENESITATSQGAANQGQTSTSKS
ncbi:NAD-dependent histone deacetylase sir2 [Malassezia yamatoensis]|uniref:NAD-dependent histone deacetylase sir2 n=1 Tax=Malassezia yamatoensis TaxID=253288 RepID=A0AAJ5YNU8_9BASI|nr:NAD-dependent histone deacetylase sir2 [Malassezia yamatoensis]